MKHVSSLLRYLLSSMFLLILYLKNLPIKTSSFLQFQQGGQRLAANFENICSISIATNSNYNSLILSFSLFLAGLLQTQVLVVFLSTFYVERPQDLTFVSDISTVTGLHFLMSFQCQCIPRSSQAVICGYPQNTQSSVSEPQTH